LVFDPMILTFSDFDSLSEGLRRLPRSMQVLPQLISALRTANRCGHGTAFGKPGVDDLGAPAVADRDGAFMLVIARRHCAKARII